MEAAAVAPVRTLAQFPGFVFRADRMHLTLILLMTIVAAASISITSAVGLRCESPSSLTASSSTDQPYIEGICAGKHYGPQNFAWLLLAIAITLLASPLLFYGCSSLPGWMARLEESVKSMNAREDQKLDGMFRLLVEGAKTPAAGGAFGMVFPVPKSSKQAPQPGQDWPTWARAIAQRLRKELDRGGPTLTSLFVISLPSSAPMPFVVLLSLAL